MSNSIFCATLIALTRFVVAQTSSKRLETNHQPNAAASAARSRPRNVRKLRRRAYAARLLLDNLIRPQQQRRRDRQRGLGGAGRGGRGRRGGRVGFGVGGAGPSCEVADVRSRRVRGGRRSRLLPLEHFALASLDETFPTRRVVFLGVAACAHPEPPQSDALAQHLITALGALGNPERRMFF